MNPWINFILLIPALLIVLTIVIIRIKGKLENNIFRYRHEGIVLHTSLVFFKMRTKDSRWEQSLGLALLTGERLIVFNWKQKPVLECEFKSSDRRVCDLKITEDNKNVYVYCECGEVPRELGLTVRNPDAWKLEFSRLRSHESSSG